VSRLPRETGTHQRATLGAKLSKREVLTVQCQVIYCLIEIVPEGLDCVGECRRVGSNPAFPSVV